MQLNGKDHPDNESTSLGDGSSAREGPIIAPVEALVGTRLDQYIILNEIGRGSMGVVFEAFETGNNRKVALKVLPPTISVSDKIIRRFLREAESVAKLRHPNIVKIYGVGHRESLYYYAMELVDGKPLDEVLAEEHPIPYRRVAKLIHQACEAIHFAHQHQIIHRDIKPGNIIVAEGDKVVITDFGLARQEKAATLTESGALVGTPIYMSPEQVMAKRGGVDKRTDIYSLGVTLYQMLTGKPPFEAQSTQRILNQILEDDPKPPHRVRKKMPTSLSIIAMKCLEKDPDSRFQSAMNLGSEIQRYLKGQSIKSKPTGFVTRLGKRVRRHKVISALAAVTILVLIAFSLNLMTTASEVKETRQNMDVMKEAQERNDLYDGKVDLVEEIFASGASANLEAAEALLGEAIQLCPERWEAHRYMGGLHLQQKDASKALEAFNTAVQCGPDSWEVFLARGLFFIEQGLERSLDSAIYLGILDIEKAMELDPENSTVIYYYAKTLYECSNATDLGAEERRDIIARAYQYVQSAQAFGTNADIECLLAQIHLEFAESATSNSERENHLDHAHLCLVNAKELDRNHRLAYRLDEEVQRRMAAPDYQPPGSDTREFIVEQGLGRFVDYAAETYDMLTQKMTKTEQRELMERIMSVILSPQPPVGVIKETLEAAAARDEEAGLDYVSLIEKASTHMEAGEHDVAIRCYKRAQILNPGQAHELHYCIGEAYLAQGRDEALIQALQHARLAYNQNPKNVQYLNLLGKVLGKMEDQAGIEKLLDEAKKNRTLQYLGVDLPFIGDKDKEKVSVPH